MAEGIWGWLDKAKQFINNVVDRVLGRGAEQTIVTKTIDINKDAVTNITLSLIEDRYTLGQWESEMREVLKDLYIQQYVLGIGGYENLGKKDFGSIGGMLADQYKYLSNFANELAAGKLSPGQILFRAEMYANSARESFGRARARAFGIPDGKLPAFPGDGKTKCLCITTPDCRILTLRGWIPMYDVIVGDKVFTHLGNWKEVTALIIKQSENDEHYLIKAPSGKLVGCTGDHLWWTEQGWKSSKYICNMPDMKMYSMREEVQTLSNGELTRPEILFDGILPRGTAVYDITVEDDESFVIEGLISHNTNCACSWEIIETDDGWDCYWRLGFADHCKDCLENAATWNPYFIPYIEDEEKSQ